MTYGTSSQAHPRTVAQAMLVPLVLLASCAYLLALTFDAEGTPLLLGGDQGFAWVHAQRMLRGELPYRDFFQFTPPGADVVFAAAFAIFGARIWVTNALVIGLGVALAVAGFLVASRIVTRTSAALAALAFTVLVYGPALRTSPHHWLSGLAIAAALATLGPESRQGRWIGAGVFLGIASLFTQTHGVVGLGAIAFLEGWAARRGDRSRRQSVRRIASLFGAFGATIAIAYAYFVYAVGLAAMWECLYVYVRHQVRRTAAFGLGLPEAVTWSSVRWLAPYLTVYAMLAAAYLLTPAFLRAKRGSVDVTRSTPVWRCWLVGVALLMEVLVALNWGRLFAVSLPGVVLFVWLLDCSGRARRALVAITWFVIVLLGCFIVRANRQRHSLLFRGPAGALRTSAATEEKLAWLHEHAARVGSFFAADEPSLYLPLGLTDENFLVAIVPARTTPPSQILKVIAGLETARTKHVLWPPRLVEEGADEDGIPALSAYLHREYRLAYTFQDGDEAWERR